MLRKITLSLITICISAIAYAQDFDVRKISLKSDVIVFYNRDSIKYIDEVKSDFTSEHFYQLLAVDTLVKNKVGFKFANTKLRNLVENEDYFNIYEKGDCLGIGRAYDGVKRQYYGMLFLKKTGKQFNVIGHVVNDNPLPNWHTLIQQIKSVAALENIKNLPERYTKSIDWFLANDRVPTEQFLKFYVQKGILKTDTAILTPAQLAVAKTKFFNGNETFLDFVSKAYPTEVKDYYVQALRNIADQASYEYGDCVRFGRVAKMLTSDFNGDYDDLNYELSNLLTNDKLEKYEKEPLMKQLIKVIEEGKYKVGPLLSEKL